MPTKVLIVDHGTTVVQSLVELVRADGHDVQVCASTISIIVALGYQPDVTLFDLSMPGPSTCDLLTQFRRELPHIPIVIVGREVEPRIVEHLLNKEAFAYISKPFTPDVIRTTIRAALSG